MTLVFNASPLIVLAKAELIDEFLGLGEKVIVPQPVADEIVRVDDPTDPARIWVFQQSREKILRPAPAVSPFVAAWDLGAGESAVIEFARADPDATAVIDDLAARRCCQALGVPITGTLGLILMAKKQGIILSASEALNAVTAAGLYIAPKHVAAIRAAAGE